MLLYSLFWGVTLFVDSLLFRCVVAVFVVFCFCFQRVLLIVLLLKCFCSLCVGLFLECLFGCVRCFFGGRGVLLFC